MVEQQDIMIPAISEMNSRIADMEEKQRLLKDKMLLIGENLVDIREQINIDLTEIKIKQGELGQDIEKLKNGFLRIGDELEKKARKSELSIIEKQLKMFEPLNFARIEDVEMMISEHFKRTGLEHQKEELKEKRGK